MSQGTPAKESRIERHLMRQRGAGVRAITADFGFSFGLPAPAIEPIASVDLPVEPPAKRRRTTENGREEVCKTENYCIAIGTQADQEALGQGARCSQRPQPRVKKENTAAKAQSASIKKPQRACRKLNLEDDIIASSRTLPPTDQRLKDDHSTKTETFRKSRKAAAKRLDAEPVDDTFIFGVNPKTRATRREQQGVVVEDDGLEAAAAMRPKKRAEGIEKPFEESNIKAKPAPFSGDKIAKPSKAGRVKAATKKITKPLAAGESQVQQCKTQNNPIPSEHELLVEEETITFKGKDTSKHSVKGEITKSRPFESLAAAEDLLPENPTKLKTKSTKKNDARSKTLPNAEVDELSFSTADVPPQAMIVSETPSESHRSKMATTESTKATAAHRKKAAERAGTSEVLQVTTRRPRRQAAISAKEKVAMGYEEELVPVERLRRAPDPVSRPGKSGDNSIDQALSTDTAHPVSMKDDLAANQACNSREGDLLRVNVQPVKAVRKAGGRPAKTKPNSKKTDEDIASVGHPTILAIPTPSEPIADAAAVVSGVDKFVTNVSSDIRKAEHASPPAKKRHVLAESDVNVARPSPPQDTSEMPVKSKKSLSTDQNDVSNRTTKASRRQNITKQVPTVDHTKPADAAGLPEKAEPNTTKHSRKPRSTVKSHSIPKGDLAVEHPLSLNKSSRTASDEDLDWLFDKPDVKHVQPCVSQAPATKARRRFADQAAKDMDLDDLLDSIAGFSGKLSTGRNGRVR